jgi:hypothetical protein
MLCNVSLRKFQRPSYNEQFLPHFCQNSLRSFHVGIFALIKIYLKYRKHSQHIAYDNTPDANFDEVMVPELMSLNRFAQRPCWYGLSDTVDEYQLGDFFF